MSVAATGLGHHGSLVSDTESVRSDRGRKRHLAGSGCAREHFRVEPEDIRVLFEVLFDVRRDLRKVLWLLEGDDDEEEEDA
jgi:hypothetical protein